MYIYTYIHTYVLLSLMYVHVDCKVVCHPKCAPDLPNTCGLPAELASEMFAQPPSSKRLKVDDQDTPTVECAQLRKEGWLQVYRAGK